MPWLFRIRARSVSLVDLCLDGVGSRHCNRATLRCWSRRLSLRQYGLLAIAVERQEQVFVPLRPLPLYKPDIDAASCRPQRQPQW
jgi:hypothetical protein